MTQNLVDPASANPYPQRTMLPPRRRKPPRVNPWLIRLPVLVFTGSILLMVVLGIFLAALQIRFTDRIVPGVSALGVDLSGLTTDEAHTVLSDSFTYASETVFTFRHGDRFWQMTAGDLGVKFDVDATVAEAFTVGHEGDLVGDLMTQGRVWFSQENIPPILSYDQNVALEKLNAIADELYQGPVNASLVIDGTQVVTTSGQVGRTVDLETTIARLNDAIVGMESGVELPLVVNETPPIVWNVEDAANRARTALSAPVSLVASNENGQQLGPWSATPEQIAALLSVTLDDNGDGTRSYYVNLNTTAFEGFLETLAPGLIASPVNARFHFNEGTRQLEVIQPAVSGRELNVTETLARMEEAIFSSDNRVAPMAFNYTLAKYHNQISAAELGITQLVGEATTFYSGSEINRRTNIAVSASKFDGVIIAPGEEFSFNYHLGDISLENGFVEGKVIFGGRTVTGVGGGVCQVSTTAFRAAFQLGYPIIERNSHGYRVGYYEQQGSAPGLDAAIWQPERDFRFLNDTPHHLLIETAIYPGQDAIQFRFYSTDTGRRVVLDDAIVKNIEPAPPVKYEANGELQLGQILQVDYAAEGADVTVYRKIYDASGNLLTEDHVYTHYLPWQAIFQVSPNDSRLATQT